MIDKRNREAEPDLGREMYPGDTAGGTSDNRSPDFWGREMYPGDTAGGKLERRTPDVWGRELYPGDTREEGHASEGLEMYALGNEHAIGPHRGLGPQNYQRSDERIHEDVCEQLLEDGYLDASNIRVMVLDSVVSLEGTVVNLVQRHRAEDLAIGVSGVKSVHNDLHISDLPTTDTLHGGTDMQGVEMRPARDRTH